LASHPSPAWHPDLPSPASAASSPQTPHTLARSRRHPDRKTHASARSFSKTSSPPSSAAPCYFAKAATSTSAAGAPHAFLRKADISASAAALDAATATPAAPTATPPAWAIQSASATPPDARPFSAFRRPAFFPLEGPRAVRVFFAGRPGTGSFLIDGTFSNAGPFSIAEVFSNAGTVWIAFLPCSSIAPVTTCCAAKFACRMAVNDDRAGRRYRSNVNICCRKVFAVVSADW